MIYIRLIFQSFFKQNIRIKLLVIQFLFGFLALFFSFSVISQMFIKKDDLEKMTDLNVIHVHTSGNPAEDINSLYSSLQSDAKIDTIGLYNIDDVYMNQIQGLQKAKNTNIKSNNNVWDEKKFSLVAMNTGFLKLFQINEIRGDSIQSYKIKDDYFPAIVGIPLENEFPIGTTFVYNNPIDNVSQDEKTLKIRIIGVIDPGYSYFTEEGNDLLSGMKKCDNPVMMVLSNQGFVKPSNDNIYFRLKDINQNSDYIMGLTNYLNSNDFKFANVLDLYGWIGEYFRNNQVIIIFSFAFSCLVLMLSTLGLIGTLLSSILRRKQEFGIRYSLGSTTRGLTLLILGEIMLIQCIALGISFIVAYVLKTQFAAEVSGFDFNLYSISWSIAISVVITGISILMPIRKISKMNPVALITERGE